ncbi:hypothetical protein BGAL_0218g00100 [Botrytis galanthina]|uniref:Transmembrane protein n=1 Tax=Botrytis galanthina TaxID=278940 RepID=A0A4S8QUI6_9HELO|nr:hypothetical protein BGAL_0218g00100 [Botrytis galanthina]
MASTDMSTQTEMRSPTSATPTKSGLHQALWGWLKDTEIRTSPLTLAIALLGLITAVIYGTSNWIQSSTAADSAAKANRLALFTACISFPEQPNIIDSNFCRANRNASLDGFAKRDVAATSLPVLWDMDVLAEALKIVQPAWQCNVLCGQEKVSHPPGLALMLSIPISNGENCQLDCLDPIQATSWEERHGEILFVTAHVLMSLPLITLSLPQRYPVFDAIATGLTFLLWFVLIPVSLITLRPQKLMLMVLTLSTIHPKWLWTFLSLCLTGKTALLSLF